MAGIKDPTDMSHDEWVAMWRLMKPPLVAHGPLLIYIAGPYSADTPEGIQENVDRAVAAGKALLKKGHYVIVPHAMTHNWDLDTGLSWDCFMDNCITLLRKSDAILMLEDWQDSTGSRIEEHNARLRRMMMFYSLDEVPTVD